MSVPANRKTSIYRIFRIILRIAAVIVLLFISLLLLIQTAFVQNFIRGKAEAYLSNKLHTRVSIGNLYIGFPKKIIIKNIYLEDRQKDTLFSGDKFEVDISMFKLLHHEIQINEISLEGVTVKIRRALPDTTFNFQFILNAFDSGGSKPKDTTKSVPWKIDLESVALAKIRLVYKDVVTGNDVDIHLSKFETEIAAFDLEKLHFDFASIKVNGLGGKIHQDSPLQYPPPVSMAVVKQVIPQQQLFLHVGDMSFTDIDMDYRNVFSALSTRFNIGEFIVGGGNIDLQKNSISLKKIALNNSTAVIKIDKNENKPGNSKTTVNETPAPWRIETGALSFNNNNIRFDDENKIMQDAGMDYAHLGVQQLILQMQNFVYAGDSLAGNITKASMTEKSGFVLNHLQTRFLYTATGAYLQDLLLQTPGTELRRSVTTHYPSLQDLKKNIGLLQLDIDLQHSTVQVKDILVFAPYLRKQPVFSNPANTWKISGRITGTVANLGIKTFRVEGLSATKIDLDGNISGFPHTDHLESRLNIKAASNRQDILLFADGKLPGNITIPETLQIAGTVDADNGALQTAMNMNSSLGNAKIKGRISQLTDIKNAAYTATLETDRLDAGKILQNEKSMGTVSAKLDIKGKGMDLKKAEASITGVISSAVIKQYDYRNLQFNGGIKNQQIQFSASIRDPNIYLSLNGSGDITAKYPSLKIEADIDSIKTSPLHFTTDAILYHGKIRADFPVTDPDHLQGNLLVTESLLVENGRRVVLDTIQLVSGVSDSGQYISLGSDILRLQLQGQYRLTQLGSVFSHAVQPYYKIATDQQPVDSSYNFTVSVNLVNKPVLKAFLPTLERLDPVNFNARFSNRDGWNAMLDAPMIIYAGYRVDKFHAESIIKDGALHIQAGVQQFKSGTSINLFHTQLDAVVKNNEINFGLDIKDSILKDKYHVSGLFQQPQQGEYVFSITPGNLLLNYDHWTVENNNKIIVSPTEIAVHNFSLQKEGQRLSINSNGSEKNAPLDVQFAHFKIATITGFIQPDSSFAGGTLDGKVTLSDLLHHPVFTSDLVIHELSIHKDTIGNVSVKVNNTAENILAADINISGHDNNIRLNGNYYLKPPGNNSFEMNLDIQQLQLSTLQAAATGVLNKASGSVSGKFTVAGNINAPVINGELNFKNATIVPSMLNSYFTMDNEKLEINKNGIKFNSFTIYDSAKNKLVLNGDISTSDFRHYNFGMTVKARNFQAMNTTKRENKLYYGQLYFNSDLNIKGTEQQPTIDGSIKIDAKTKLTVVLPQQDPGIEDRKGVIQFVNMRSPSRDSIFSSHEDSLNTSSILGFDISTNISLDKEAEFSLVIDEGNGDFLRMKGEGALTGGIDKSGKTTLSGTYRLDQGSYDLSFSLLHRKFEIAKGSTITWTGEPTKANLDINAIYTANTAPADLVEDQLDQSTATVRNTYLQRLPFQVYLKMKGELLKPDITFDIILPQDKNYNVSKDIITTVETKLDLLRQEPSEMNKQVIALLLLGRFVSEDPFAGSNGGTNAESLARQSVSKLLTEQLNKLATSLVKGVDLNFDVQSTDDYTTGQLQNRTDLNVALSKKLLNDRLTVTVGSNFELEGPQQTSDQSNNLAGNIAVDYKLSKDGRYLLRAYRKNDFDEVLEGYVVETGMGFIITVDYNHFHEIFERKKKRAGQAGKK